MVLLVALKTKGSNWRGSEIWIFIGSWTSSVTKHGADIRIRVGDGDDFKIEADDSDVEFRGFGFFATDVSTSSRRVWMLVFLGRLYSLE